MSENYFFVGFCPKCGNKIFLENKEIKRFIKENKTKVLRKRVDWLLSRLPRIRIEWGRPSGVSYSQIEKKEEKTEVEKTTEEPRPKKNTLIDLELFDRTYQDKGGVKKLEELIRHEYSLREIGNSFGISHQWALKAKNTFLEEHEEEILEKLREVLQKEGKGRYFRILEKWLSGKKQKFIQEEEGLSQHAISLIINVRVPRIAKKHGLTLFSSLFQQRRNLKIEDYQNFLEGFDNDYKDKGGAKMARYMVRNLGDGKQGLLARFNCSEEEAEIVGKAIRKIPLSELPEKFRGTPKEAQR